MQSPDNYLNKSYISIFFSVIASVFIFISGCSDPKETQTNVVFIVADDMGWSQVGCYGSSYYKTPFIDSLAKEGLRFTHAYAASPVCSPSRASIMTGKYPARLHLTDFIPGNSFPDSLLATPEWQKYLLLEEHTIAELAKMAGYNTAMFGKWHLSIHKTPPESLPYNPDKQGFDSTFVTYKPSRTMAQPWQAAGQDAHNVDTITNLALQFMEDKKDEPFFLFISHNTIHDPLMEQAETINRYKNDSLSKFPENHPVIGAMIDRLDKSVGRVLHKLEELNLEEETMVIFYSDNGGKEAYAAQSPFKKGKGWLYEGGIRVPLIIRWPGFINKGAISSEIVTSNDFYPTFAKILHQSIENQIIDGVELTEIFNYTTPDDLRNTFYWHYPHYHNGSGMKPAGAIRQDSMKLIEWYEKKLLGEEDYFELYNLLNDPGETHNLADSLPTVAKQLLKKVDEWRKETNAQMPVLRGALLPTMASESNN